MINKQSLWFLTLFSLILVLSVYYVTMPNELLLTNNGNYNGENNDKNNEENEPTVNVNESEILVALRLEANEQTNKELSDLQIILTNIDASVEERNNAFEKIKLINEIKALEQKIEKDILDEYKLKAFIKINGDQVRIVVNSSNHDNTLANNIMRKVQENFDKQMYISVKFQQ